jgi:phosphate transport system substrate-binding protein
VVVLEFANEGSVAAWERDAAPALPKGLIVRRADALVHGEVSPRDSNHSIFIVNAYTPTVSRERYNEFAQGYIKPLYEAMRATKHLIRYTMYHERGEQGQVNALTVLEYRDSVALAAITAQKLADPREAHRDGPDLRVLRQDQGHAAARRSRHGGHLHRAARARPDRPAALQARDEDRRRRTHPWQRAEERGRLPRGGLQQFHPEARVSTSYMTSSEGGLAGLYTGISDVAPMGDDAKITDQMPFFNVFGYMPTSSPSRPAATRSAARFRVGDRRQPGQPLEEISMDQLERVFGSERTGGWDLVNNNWLYTAKYARGAESNIRKWGQLGLEGEFADRDIATFGYIAPGFEISVQRTLFHWSDKWNGNFMQYVETKQTTPDAEGAKVDSVRPLEMLEHNKFAIGIAALMHVKDFPHVKVLKVSPRRGGPAVALTPDNVANRVYPLIRDAYFYVNKPPGGKLDPRAREFMRFVLSREGQEIIAKVGYYYPLPKAYLLEQLKKLD